MKKMLICLVFACLVGCTDAQVSKLAAYGDSARVTCYSGGEVVFDAYSTGKVAKPDSGSDGYQFRDTRTGRLVEVSMDCKIDYGSTPPEESE